jgi:HAMP domain-containing protein
MSKKKATPARRARASKGKGKGKGATLEARAEAIIEDCSRYKIDARKSVELALKNYRFNRDGSSHVGFEPQDAATVARYELELRDLCDRAEKGDPLNAEDLATVDAEAVEAARAVMHMIDGSAPEFISDALFVALMETQKATDAGLWQTVGDDDATGEFSLTVMARTFAQHPRLSIPLERRHDLADHVAAVMRHKDTPAQLYNAMQEALSEAINTRHVFRVARRHPRRAGSPQGARRGALTTTRASLTLARRSYPVECPDRITRRHHKS